MAKQLSNKNRKIEIVLCLCGCNRKLNKYDKRNRVRKSLPGHLLRLNSKRFVKGYKPWNKGTTGLTEPWNKGKTRQKDGRIAQPWLGKKRNTETRYKISETKTGVSLTVEHRAKLSKAHMGNKAYNWKGNKSGNSRRLRNRVAYKAWRTLVFERDNYTCQRCEIIGGSLNAHHIKNVANYPDLIYEVSNGVTLCEECHAEVDIHYAKFFKGKEVKGG